MFVFAYFKCKLINFICFVVFFCEIVGMHLQLKILMPYYGKNVQWRTHKIYLLNENEFKNGK